MKQLERTYVTEKHFRHSRRKLQNLSINSQNCDYYQTLHVRAMTHWRTQWRTIQSCLRFEPIWTDSENKFTPLFVRYTTVCATLKIEENVIQKEAKPYWAFTRCDRRPDWSARLSGRPVGLSVYTMQSSSRPVHPTHATYDWSVKLVWATDQADGSSTCQSNLCTPFCWHVLYGGKPKLSRYSKCNFVPLFSNKMDDGYYGAAAAALIVVQRRRRRREQHQRYMGTTVVTEQNRWMRNIKFRGLRTSRWYVGIPQFSTHGIYWIQWDSWGNQGRHYENGHGDAWFGNAKREAGGHSLLSRIR